MLLTAYNTAARVSELAGMMRADADLAPALGTVKIHGKGRKERVVVLSRDATAVLRRWAASTLPPPRRCSRIARASR